MALDVETPDPPDLTNRSLPSEFDPLEDVDDLGDLRRAELEEILHDGAWNEAFREWAEYTDLDEEEFRTVLDAGWVDELDVYWHPTERRVRFEVPDPPAAVSWNERLSTRATVELTDLGETVVETIEDGYVDWDEEGTGVAAWREETRSEEESSLDDS